MSYLVLFLRRYRIRPLAALTTTPNRNGFNRGKSRANDRSPVAWVMWAIIIRIVDSHIHKLHFESDPPFVLDLVSSITSGRFNHTVMARHPALLTFVFLPLCIFVIFVYVFLPLEKDFTASEPRQDYNPSSIKSRLARGEPTSGSTILTTLFGSLMRFHSKNNVVSHPHTHVSSKAVQEPCKPIQRIVFIKTHKTASTTTATILERFGYLRNLSFALGKWSHIICGTRLFNRALVYKVPYRKRHDFDMLVNHARYNRKEMDIAVPGAKYISIIRDPVTHLESTFGYTEMWKHLGIKSSNPFKTFMSNPRMYYENKLYYRPRSRNGQLFDLGFDHKDEENKTKIEKKIKELSQEIDLMMITEYYDESLILLRKLMCWDFEDILYISKGVRSKSHRFKVSKSMAADIRAWSSGDSMLYDHFNRTFWQKVEEYGPAFNEDLAHFRKLMDKVAKKCIQPDEKNTKDKRVDKFVLKKHSKYCKNMIRRDTQYVPLIRKQMNERAATEVVLKNKSALRNIHAFHHQSKVKQKQKKQKQKNI